MIELRTAGRCSTIARCCRPRAWLKLTSSARAHPIASCSTRSDARLRAAGLRAEWPGRRAASRRSRCASPGGRRRTADVDDAPAEGIAAIPAARCANGSPPGDRGEGAIAVARVAQRVLRAAVLNAAPRPLCGWRSSMPASDGHALPGRLRRRDGSEASTQHTPLSTHLFTQPLNSPLPSPPIHFPLPPPLPHSNYLSFPPHHPHPPTHLPPLPLLPSPLRLTPPYPTPQNTPPPHGPLFDIIIPLAALYYETRLDTVVERREKNGDRN